MIYLLTSGLLGLLTCFTPKMIRLPDRRFFGVPPSRLSGMPSNPCWNCGLRIPRLPNLSCGSWPKPGRSTLCLRAEYILTMENLRNYRNIGISAHIDSGKTTLTERMLYYTGRTHVIKEVKGEGAVMDHMELEKERGITITSAATTVQWDDKTINIIDTPGHVDFTVEVERSLRVLDGAVLVLCAVAGVQSQSITVDRQMKRYAVPRIAFINKMDRTGANPANVIQQLETKLNLTAIPLQLPIGTESNFRGVIDLIERQAIFFGGDNGEDVRTEPVPADLVEATERARQGMLEALSMVSDEIMELLLEEVDVPLDLIHKTIREGTIAQQLCPVMVGSAYRNKGVQPLLDAICRYLPTPLDREIFAKDNNNGMAEIPLSADPDAPLVAMAFKLVEESFGQVTYMRIYQGTLAKGTFYFNARQHKRARISRILRVHADQKEDIDSAPAGDIVAVMGLECATGDTYCSEGTNVSLESIYAAEPVIDLSIEPAKRADYDKLSKALNRFMREVPRSGCTLTPRPARPSSRGWASSTSRSTSSEFAASTRSNAPWALPRSAIARRRPARRRSTTSTGNRPAAPVSTPTSWAS